MNDHFEKRLRQDLRAREADMDAKDVFGLAQARNNALKGKQKRKRGLQLLWPAMGTAFASVLLVMIFTGSPERATAPKGLAADDYLLDENADLYEDLEFYYWIAETENRGTG